MKTNWASNCFHRDQAVFGGEVYKNKLLSLFGRQCSVCGSKTNTSCVRTKDNRMMRFWSAPGTCIDLWRNQYKFVFENKKYFALMCDRCLTNHEEY